ncbi:MmcQ/YjbR family DNA-binding protein [Ferruginibacter paludis]|uniref:MmcQ/YjbR family DNA-binding protein n=1 Tax=Ferruginibacter paludis TaxID=1310417 RepID=UPI0025B5595E|nr:MmcQ/YjbR family DNA-binding protein [Ferruginibacter paludis]MDN3656964.1 MmcQ/YjbR family DNA-binding protein [Ferruginibacter paludis]
MANIDQFKKLALSFAETEAAPHFDKTAFRFKTKIWATLDETEQVACFKLSLKEQSVFCAFDNSIIYPVKNKWGLQGWTLVDLRKIRLGMLKDIASVAYNEMIQGKSKPNKKD